MGIADMTPEQRAAALAKAAKVRADKSEALANFATGHIDLKAALELDVLRGVKARVLLVRLPGIGDVAAGRILDAAGIGHDKKIGGLGVRQRAALLAAVGVSEKA